MNTADYSNEAKQRWGYTAAYRESQQRLSGQSKAQVNALGEGLIAVFAEFGTLRGTDPSSKEAQALAAKLQQYITDHFYTCTKPILSGLGQMYIADERFRQNIDRAGGEGTAAFAAEAIRIFCE